MKVLISFEGRVRPDSTGFHVAKGFQELGHEVSHVLPEDIFKVKDSYDLYVKVDDGQKVTAWNPDLHPSHYFCIDTHIENDWRVKLAQEGKFDTVSVVHSSGLNIPWGRDDVYFLPVGCTPEWNHTGKWAKEYDGCFIGNFHNNLAGPRVEMLDVFFKACPGPIFFGNRTFKEQAEKYGKSKLVFNRSINCGGGEGVNMRAFEAMCSGSCLVTDRVPDLDRLGFVDGVHYAGYSTKEQLEYVVKDLLRNEEKREYIAKTGREEVLKNHTYAHRASVLIGNLTKQMEKTNGPLVCR